MYAEQIGALVGTALAIVTPIGAGIWLWVAGNRRIRNGGRYTMKYWGIGLVALFGLMQLPSLVVDPSLARTREPKTDTVPSAHEQPMAVEKPQASEPKNKIPAETIVDALESRKPGFIDRFCSAYDKYDFTVAAFAKGYNPVVKGHSGLPTAKEAFDELLRRC
jgi:hypothetical protein